MLGKNFKTMAKPICVVKAILEQLRPTDQDALTEFNIVLSEKMPDYHVFVLPQEDMENYHDVLEFQVFYDKDFTPIQYEELRKLIEDTLKAQKTEA